ncbi:MAG: hypothetical protein JJV98_14125 [Desulfosarcina sp.]|nr:hypothetical protein [Desulfobacterales bacterium]
MPATSPERVDNLSRATGLLLLAVILTVLPVGLMATDHLIRQKPGLERQAGIFAALGLTSPCFFPSGHPARTRLDNDSAIDWRFRPSLARPQPGPCDLVRPTAVDPRGKSGHAF